jgi:hypothetical protein
MAVTADEVEHYLCQSVASPSGWGRMTLGTARPGNQGEITVRQTHNLSSTATQERAIGGTDTSVGAGNGSPARPGTVHRLHLSVP